MAARAAAPTLVGAWPEVARMASVEGLAVARVGGQVHAFVAAGTAGLHILSLTNLAVPNRVGVYDSVGFASSVAVGVHPVTGKPYAYLADLGGGLVVLDVSNPAQPTRIGRLNLGGAITRVSVSGALLLVADRVAGLLAIDVQDPTRPRALGGFSNGSEVRAFAWVGSRVYVADERRTVTILDVTEPLSIRQLGTYTGTNALRGIGVTGGFAYLVDSAPSLKVVDVTNPAMPTFRSEVSLPAPPERIVISGGAAYVAGGLLVPVSLGTSPPTVWNGVSTGGNAAMDVAVLEGFAYVLDRVAGFRVYSVASPTVPVAIGAGYRIPGRAEGIAGFGAGRYAAVADGSVGLRILDVSDPRRPGVGTPGETQVFTSGQAVGVKVVGTRAYVANGSGGLAVVNLTSAMSPVLESSYQPTNAAAYVQAVAVEGATAYLAAGSGGLEVVDVTVGATPRRLARLATAGAAVAVAVTNGYVFVGVEGQGMVVVDARVRTVPSAIATNSAGGFVRDIALRNGMAFLAADSTGLLVVDVTRPSRPTNLVTVPTVGQSSRITLDGRFGFLGNGETGVRAIDLQDPLHPGELLSVDTDGTALGLAVINGHLHVADGSRVLVMSIDELIPLPNQPPSFVVGPNVEVLEDSGPRTINGWATGISPGPATESWQTVTFSQVVASPPGLFSFGPSLGPDGTLRFIPATNAFGRATCRVLAVDNGGTQNGGIDTFEQTFTIDLLPVNDRPVMDSLADVGWREDGTVRPVPLSGIFAGPTNELQRLTLTVTSENPADVPNPIVQYTSPLSRGTLLVQPRSNWFGRVWMNLVLRDDGGTANGGVDIFTNRFRVSVRQVDDAPLVTIDSPADGSIFTVGDTIRVTVTATDLETAIGSIELISDVDGLIGRRDAPAETEVVDWGPRSGGARILRAKATDLDGLSSTSAPVRVVVNAPPNRPPVVTGMQPLRVAEDASPPSITLTVTDDHTPSEAVQLRAVCSDPGLVGVSGLSWSGTGATRVLRVAPTANAYGSALLVVVAEDGAGLTSTNVTTLVVDPVNDPPVISLVGPAEGARFLVGATVRIEAVATDLERGTLRVEFVADGLVLGSAVEPPYVFDWRGASVGEHVLSARVTDGEGSSATSGSVRVRIEEPPNQAPTLRGEGNLAMDEDPVEPGIWTVTMSDDRTPPGLLRLLAYAENPDLVPETGISIEGGDAVRTLRVRPAPDANGSTRLVLVVTDGDGASATNWADVRVRAVNDAPKWAVIIGPRDGSVFSTEEDIAISAAAFDVEGDLARVEVLADGVVLGGAAGDSYADTWSGASVGEHRLIAVATDFGGLATTSAPVNLRVELPANRPPRITGVGRLTMPEDPGEVPTLAVTLSDDRTPVELLRVLAYCDDTRLIPENGVEVGGSGASRTIAVRPARDAYGSTTLWIVATDQDGLVATNGFPVEVTPVADSPRVEITRPVEGGRMVLGDRIRVEASVSDPDSPDVLVEVRADGERVGPPTGAPYVVDWSGAALGSHVLVAVATDSGGLSATSSPVRIEVELPANRPPVVVGTGQLEMREDPVELPVLALEISDDRTPAGQVRLEWQSEDEGLIGPSGILVSGVGALRSITVRPLPNAHGTTRLRVVAVDTDGLSSTNYFPVTVIPENDAPRVVLTQPLEGDVVTTEQTVLLTAVATDVDGTVARVEFRGDDVVVGSDSASPYVSLWAGLGLGPHVVTAVATDGEGLSVTSAPVRIVVERPPNRPPTLGGGGDVELLEDESGAFTVTVGDDRTPVEALVVRAESVDPELLGSEGIDLAGTGAVRTITLKPATNAFGSTVVWVVARDGDGLSTTNWYPVTVLPVNDAPVVRLTTPTEGAVFTTELVVTLAAVAEDVEGAVSRVEFRRDGVALGTDESAPYGTTWASPTLGAHVLTAVATDGEGLSVTSAPVRIVVELPPNRPPTISGGNDVEILEDGEGTLTVTVADDRTAPGLVTVSATALDGVLLPATGIEVSVAEAEAEAERSIRLKPSTNAVGSTVVVVVARDAEGLTTTNRYAVVVKPVNDAPVVRLTEPTEGAVFTTEQVVTLAAVAEDVEGAVSRVEFRRDGVALGTDESAPYGTTWASPTLGVHVLTVVATDGEGLSVTSAPVRIVVELPPNRPPTISGGNDVEMLEDGVATLTVTVADDRTAPGLVTVRATALDGVLLPATGIEVSVAEAEAEAERSIRLKPSTNAVGSTVVVVVARDAEGLTTTNRYAVVVRSVNDAPVVRLTTPTEGAVFTTEQVVTLAALAEDVEGAVSRVEFRRDGVALGTDESAPYGTTWASPTLGAHVLTAVATDGEGLSVTSAPVRIVVELPPNRPPTISGGNDVEMLEDGVATLTVTVADDRTAPGLVTVRATALDGVLLPATGIEVSVAEAEAEAERSIRLKPSTNAVGSTVVVVVARDGDGLSTTNRYAVVVRPVNDAPTVALVRPSEGTRFSTGGTVSLEAMATDAENEIAWVEFRRDDVVLGRDVQAPYGIKWTGLALGAHVLTAVATDGEGLSVTSAPVRIVVELPPNRPPTLSGGSDVEMLEDEVGTLTVTVADERTAAGLVSVSATALDGVLLSATGIEVKGTEAVRTVTLKPSTNAFGSTVVVVVARDADGLSTTNRYTVVVKAVNDAPVVKLTQPVESAVFTTEQVVALAAVAGDVEGPVNRVEFRWDGVALETDTVAPYGVTWASPTLGAHVLTAVATDGEGLSVTSAPVRIVVELPPNRPPRIAGGSDVEMLEDGVGTLTMTVADDRTAAGLVSVSATALDDGLLPATGIEVKAADAVRTVTLKPSTNAFGSTVVVLVARDGDGLSTTNRYAVVVKPVNDAPVVRLTTPTEGAVFTTEQVVTLGAEADDVDGVVSRVEFRRDGVALGADESAPYGTTWSSPTLGAHVLTAVATDGEGLSVTSAPVRIVVELPPNRPPTVVGGGPLSLYRDGISPPIQLTLGDDSTPPAELRLDVTASDEVLFPRSGMTVSGAGAVRTLVLAPAQGQYGNALIRVVVTDGGGLTGVRELAIQVLPVSELPGGEPCFADSVPAGYGTFNVLKHAEYSQGPGEGPVGTRAVASIELRAPPTYSIRSAQVSGGATFRVALARRDDGLFTWSETGDESALLASLPSGAWSTSYRLALPSGEAFSGFFPYTVLTNLAPVPEVLNLNAAQAIDPDANFTLTWRAWSGSSTNDRVLLTIVDAEGRGVVEAASDCSGQSVLPRRSGGWEIPAGRLAAGARFKGYLTFGATQLSVNDKSPLLMLRAYHSRTTLFDLQTRSSGGGAVAAVLEAPRFVAGNVLVRITGTPGARYRIEASRDLQAWTPVVEVTVDPGGVNEVQLPVGVFGEARFYRAVVVSSGPVGDRVIRAEAGLIGAATR